MISYIWAILALVVGMLMGLFFAALLEAGREDDREE